MIKNKVLVSRYAEAFLKFARVNCGSVKALEDLAVVKKIIQDNLDFNNLMYHPEVPYSEKCAIIDGVIKDGISDEMRNFLKLLLEKKRFDIFLDVAEYLRVKYSHEGQVDVLLKTAFPLELELIEKIQAALRNKFKQNLRFYIDLDGSLMGGVQVVIGNTIIDGSIRKRLAELRDTLITVELA
jgi:F-type H+-transporting ATPase subunit delta